MAYDPSFGSDGKICLVGSLTIADFVDPALTLSASARYAGPQLGVLTLAAVLRARGFDVRVLDLDQLFLDLIKLKRSRGAVLRDNEFYGRAVEVLEEIDADILGFSTICSSYPLTLRLAEAAKRQRPEAPIILGGPQASVVDVQTMNHFSFVDVVVRGEAEETLPSLIESWCDGEAGLLRTIGGITFREPSGIVRNPNAPPPTDLDCIPLPAYDLDPLIRQRNNIHLEIGRGCPFACTFCSTNDFFRRKFRLKSARHAVDQMMYLNETYGISSFSLVHDMFTVDRRRVVEFCEELLAREAHFYWGCSARTDCIDDDLIGLMDDAGCKGIFFGIEVGNSRLQKLIKKNLDLDGARERIAFSDKKGIKTAVALITGFPEEFREDLRDTMHFFIDAYRFDNAEPQISLLAPLAETPIETHYRGRLIFDRIFSDMSHQGWQQDPDDLRLIEEHPEIFSNFYAVPMDYLDRAYVKDVRDFVVAITTWFRWLPLVLMHYTNDILIVFDAWRASGMVPLVNDRSDRAPYYNTKDFATDFIKFVQSYDLCMSESAKNSFMTLVSVESPDKSNVGANGASPPVTGATNASDAASMDVRPYAVPGLYTLDVSCDCRELLRRIKDREGIEGIPSGQFTLAFRENAMREVEIHQLTALASRLLKLCDGKSSAWGMAGEFGDWSASRGIQAEKLVIYGLGLLRQNGLIEIAA